MTNTTLLAAILGAVLVIASALMSPYKDPSVIAHARTLYPAEISSSNDASAKYFATRDAQLTNKFLLQDYGLTFLELVVVSMFLRGAYSTRRYRDFPLINNPSQLWKVVLVGVVAAAAATATYVLSLTIGATRDEYPPWVIPLEFRWLECPSYL